MMKRTLIFSVVFVLVLTALTASALANGSRPDPGTGDRTLSVMKVRP